jgi:hypothetical protein
LSRDLCVDGGAGVAIGGITVESCRPAVAAQDDLKPWRSIVGPIAVTAGLFRGALVPTSRCSTSHRGTAGRRNEEELQRTAVDRQPLLSGKLFIQVGRCDVAAAAANDEHVSPLSHGATSGRQRRRNRGLFFGSQM